MDDFLSLIGDFFEGIANGGRKVFSGIGKAFCLFGDFLLDGIEWMDTSFSSRREEKKAKKNKKYKESGKIYDNIMYQVVSSENSTEEYSSKKEELYKLRNSILSTKIENGNSPKEKTFIKK